MASQTVNQPSSHFTNLGFESTHQSSTGARTGRLVTPHGIVETPAFIFCATRAAMRVALPAQLKSVGTQIILSNTYHLMLQPGAEGVRKLGGLHKMTGWDGPMLTDSGGFQIFSLGHGGELIGDGKKASAKSNSGGEIKRRRSTSKAESENQSYRSMVKISEEGAVFRSPIDGAMHHLTPESAIDLQRQIGADLIVVLDDCTPMHVDKEATARSTRMSMRWATRCLNRFEATHDNALTRQGLYSVSQGGVYPDLRREYAKFMNDQPFFGHAIGGSWGDTKTQMYDIIGAAAEDLDKSRPIHLLGCGGIDDIFHCVRYGIDSFDCVHPTRIARHAMAYSFGEPNHRMCLTHARFRGDETPLSETINSPVAHFSRGYLHHLLKARELLAIQILSLHNIAFINQLFADIRQAIADETLDQLQATWMDYMHRPSAAA